MYENRESAHHTTNGGEMFYNPVPSKFTIVLMNIIHQLNKQICFNQGNKLRKNKQP